MASEEYRYLYDKSTKAIISHNTNMMTMLLENIAQRGYLDLVEYLVNNGAEITQEALEHASEEGHLNVVKFLVNNGAEVTEYALGYAIENNHKRVAKRSSSAYVLPVEDLRSFTKYLETILKSYTSNTLNKLNTATNLLICSNITNVQQEKVIRDFFVIMSKIGKDNVSLNNTLTIDSINRNQHKVDIDGAFSSPEVEEILGNRKYDRIMLFYCPFTIYTHHFDEPLSEDMIEFWSAVNKHLKHNGVVTVFKINETLLDYLEEKYNIVYQEEFTVRSPARLIPIYVLRKI